VIPLPVLAIETSCDETSTAVLDINNKILSLRIFSQVDEHSKFGGVVPEIASRRHLEVLPQLVKEVIEESGAEIKSVAVTKGPGLIGSLLVGVSFAKGFAYSKKIPLYPIHHIEGHIAAIFLERPDWNAPFLTLVVSGGHTELLNIEEDGKIIRLARTLDDAAGEAFDKAARMLKLGYPGGPALARAAEDAGGKTEILSGQIMRHSDDFSFSGLKTALRNRIAKEPELSKELSSILAASFEEAVVDNLIEKTLSALNKTGSKKLAVVGGVAANRKLREKMKELANNKKIDIHIPDKKYCTDNAAMIGSAAVMRHREDEGYSWNAEASWNILELNRIV